MQSKARTVKEYLDSLPEDRKQAMTNLRKAIVKNLPEGFEEVMSYGAMGWVVPHSLHPAGYHCDPKQPLPFLGLASQKNYISVYHMALYGQLLDWFKDQWGEVTTKKLDMGKCCIRFKKPSDIPFDLIGELASKMTPQQWIDIYMNALKKNKK